jgi:type IV secretion system protein VirB3
MSVIKSDPLFLGLTRPAMLFGVSFPFAAINGFVCLIYFIATNDFKGFIILPFFHGIGYLICSKEPIAMELMMMKASKFSRCPNKTYFGANSYDVY